MPYFLLARILTIRHFFWTSIHPPINYMYNTFGVPHHFTFFVHTPQFVHSRFVDTQCHAWQTCTTRARPPRATVDSARVPRLLERCLGSLLDLRISNTSHRLPSLRHPWPATPLLPTGPNYYLAILANWTINALAATSIRPNLRWSNRFFRQVDRSTTKEDKRAWLIRIIVSCRRRECDWYEQGWKVWTKEGLLLLKSCLNERVSTKNRCVGYCNEVWKTHSGEGVYCSRFNHTPRLSGKIPSNFWKNAFFYYTRSEVSWRRSVGWDCSLCRRVFALCLSLPLFAGQQRCCVTLVWRVSGLGSRYDKK